MYEKINHPQKKFEVVYVSGDRDQDGLSTSMKDMPWYTLPLGQKADVESKVPCTGYPTPGLVKGDGTVINPDMFDGFSIEMLKDGLNK